MFSVVIPLYNKENQIKKTLESVLNQTFKDFEVVIVNDGSKDKSVEVVEAFDDPRIRLINQENAGVSAARNRGIKEANNEWIAFLDADDLWKVNHLQVLNQMINERDEKVFCTSFIRSNQQENLGNKDSSVDLIDDYFSKVIESGHFFWTSIVCINKDVFNKVGVFKEFLSRGEDLDLWARIGAKYSIVRSNLITAIYVQEAEYKLSTTKTNLNKSIVNYIDFSKTMSITEKQYYKWLIRNRIKRAVKESDFKLVLQLIAKYKLNVI